MAKSGVGQIQSADIDKPGSDSKVPLTGCRLLAVGAFAGRLERGGGRGRSGRRLHLRRPPRLARDGDAHDQLAVGVNHRRRHALASGPA